jgi:hypothetical protein
MKKIAFTFVFITTVLLLNAQIKPKSGAVKMYNGRPVIEINGTPQYPLLYALTDVPGGRWAWEELPRYNIQNFYKSGFRLFQVDIAFDHVWLPDNSINLDTIRLQLKGILDVCPDASIFIRFHVNPPKWWQEKFPEENTLYADTVATPDVKWGIQRLIQDDERTPARTSLASARWKNEAGAKLKEMLAKLQLLSEANALAGIQVAGGVYGEWHYWGFLDNEPDVSKPMQDYFRQWLAEKYTTPKQLQQAWHDTAANFENAVLPTLAEKQHTKAGIFRNPVEERKTIDYYEAQHNCVADDILFFCKLVKDNWPRPIITGSFYGYYYAVFGRETAGGHLALQKLLNSPDIDFLSGPAAYYPESSQTGDAYRSRGLINSVILHNKLWLDEMDQQPPLVSWYDTTYKTNLAKSIANVRRNMLYTYTHGTGFWFYDFGPSSFNGGPRLKDHGTVGWWDQPSVMAAIKKLKLSFDSLLSKPFVSAADVLLVHDTKTFYYTGSSKQSSYMAHWANNWIPPAIFKTGVLHDVINLADLDKVNIDQYKAVVFVNAWIINDRQKALIKNKIEKNNRNLVWIYAPGYGNEKELNSNFMEQLTGIKIKQVAAAVATMIVADSITTNRKLFSASHTVDPLFIADDKKATVLGNFENIAGAAFVRKELKQFTSWYMAVPPAGIDLWRYVFKQSGVHIYETGNDVLYGGNHVLTIHSAKGGQRQVTLANGKIIKLNVNPDSTIVLDSETGELSFW